jgi:hypothetical protein
MKRNDIKLKGVTIIMFFGKRPWQVKHREEIIFLFWDINVEHIIKAVCSNVGNISGGWGLNFIVRVDGKPQIKLNHLELKPYLEKEEAEHRKDMAELMEAAFALKKEPTRE